MPCGHTYSIRRTWHPGGETRPDYVIRGDFTTRLFQLPDFFRDVGAKMRCMFSRNPGCLKNHSLLLFRALDQLIEIRGSEW
jgi:hypothetical protein